MTLLGCGELKNKINDGAIVIDVREPFELLQTGKLPNAHNIPLSALNKIFDMFEQDLEILVYCRTGARSEFAKQQLQQAGYDAKNIGGVIHYQQCLQRA